ncbi:DUF4157 domain-containing protein [Bacteroides fragilis]|uniref:eCIS core domain-containing protein n=1 Tax=Bacteroides fragilis TaxID=817 RepID=UPI0021694440|nr:DUF4157 domain-containing protein [Bacteroides fragilis]
MAEYGREQRNQLSRAITNSEVGSRQLKGFVDNRPQAVNQTKLIDSIQKKPNNTGLPDNLKLGIENLSGYSMDDVRVHYNSDKPAQLSALAYAQGTDIHVAPGQESHLPHEAWHVVQQKQGRVQPTVQLQGINVNDNEGLEREADVMGNILYSNHQMIKSRYSNEKENGGVSQRCIQKKDNYHSEENTPKESTKLEVILLMIKDIANKGLKAGVPEAPTILSFIADFENILNSRDASTEVYIEKILIDELEKNEVDISNLSNLEINENDTDEEPIQGFWLETLWCVMGIPLAFVAAALSSPLLAILLALKHCIGYKLQNLPNPPVGINQPLTVPLIHKAGFTLILQGMPFVQDLYNGNIQNNMNQNPPVAPIPAGQWHNGGNLQNTIIQIDDGNIATRDRSEIINNRFNMKVAKADSFIKQAVHIMLLSNINRPAINVHLRNKQTAYRPWGFRAEYNNTGVHVAQDTDTETIVHEVGHHIENSDRALGPGSPMLDMDALLHLRNNGNGIAKYIYPQSFEEQRYSGDYPATGKYTSKYYLGGSTEVMSMSLEYLSHPQKFRVLIEQDPQQAAIILRIIQPIQFNALNLNPAGIDYGQYLP